MVHQKCIESTRSKANSKIYCACFSFLKLHIMIKAYNITITLDYPLYNFSELKELEAHTCNLHADVSTRR
mgnify:CR=1 FL=1